MKAVPIRRPGGPEVLQLEEMPTPEPGAGQALIRLRAAAVNHRDLYLRLGRQLTDALPYIPGSDGAGVVERLGDGVTGVAPGDEVVVYPVLADYTCGYCLAGEHSLCENFRILGGPDNGTYAEYLVVPATNVHPKPSPLTWEEAAAFPLASLTAYRMVMDRAVVRPGERVLIHGIGGGVATFALQLAKLAGAQVFVTSSSDAKLARAEALGADATINYARDDWQAEVNRLSGGRGVDVVVETVGAATWQRSLEAVRRGGRVVMCGATTGTQSETNLRTIYWNQLTVVGSTMGNQREFGEMLRLYEAGKVKPVIDTVIPLADAAAAHRRMDEQEQFGKIVLALA